MDRFYNNPNLAKVSRSMFFEAIQIWNLKTLREYQQIKVYNNNELVGYSEKGFTKEDYFIDIKYLIREKIEK